jgi:hypothetical protein
MPEEKVRDALGLVNDEEREQFNWTDPARRWFTDLLVHRPSPDVPLVETFRWNETEMQASIDAGKDAAIKQAEAVGAFLARTREGRDSCSSEARHFDE